MSARIVRGGRLGRRRRGRPDDDAETRPNRLPDPSPPLSTDLSMAARTSRSKRLFPAGKVSPAGIRRPSGVGDNREHMFLLPCIGIWQPSTSTGLVRRRRIDSHFHDCDRTSERLGADRAAAEPRGRGVGPRRDAPVPDRGRDRQRDSRRVRLLPREPRQDRSAPPSACGRRASPSTRSRSRTSSTSAGELEAVGGQSTVAELAALVPSTSNVEHYARIVKEMATLRGLVRAGRRSRSSARRGRAR